MSHEIRADYRQKYLLPPSLDDWVGSDHPARFVRDFVDALDLPSLGFSVRESETGRPNYASDLLLKVWLYGYLHRIRSTRALERACLNDLGLVWLTGRHAPDHNTLWRFLKGHRQALRDLSSEVVRVASRCSLVGMVLHAVDGTKVAARSSRRSGRYRKDLERALKKLDASVDEYLSRVEQSEAEETGEYRLPEELQDAEERRKKIVRALEELHEQDREQQHPDEPDAQMVKTREGTTFGYNAQAVVDEHSGLIVTQDVVRSAADRCELVPMIERVEQVLGQTAEQTLADGGYASGEQLEQARQRGYGVLVSLPARWKSDPSHPYRSANFTYDEARDCCVCPRGEKLTLQGQRSRRGRQQVRVYRCRSHKSCPERESCTRDPRGRMVEVSPYRKAILEQQRLQEDSRHQERLKKRGAIVEPVFGRIKENGGFRRWTVRGLDAVRAQWDLVCTSFNLDRLYRIWTAGGLRLKPV